jgi:vacuolar-type H+-ATPase subunit H
MLDYTSIKGLSKQIGRSTKDLVALATQNDPFYADQMGRRANAEWFADLWHRFGFQHGVHCRRIHYQLISQAKDGPPVLKPDGAVYENTEKAWALLSKASRDARFLNLIPLDALVDRRNDEPMIFTPGRWPRLPSLSVDDTTPDIGYVEDMPELPSLNLLGMEPCQSHVVEVWIEKSTQNDWLVPLCRERGVTLVTGIGEQSEIRSRQLILRAAEHEKPTRVIYLSDFDPGGQSMPVAVARKAEFYIHKLDLDVDFTLTPLVLTADQCLAYDLPRTPIKESERRKDKFERRFGPGATALDAMEAIHPGELARLLEEEIDLYLDPTLKERVREARWKLSRQLSDIEKKAREPHQEALDGLEAEYQEIVEHLREWEQRAQSTWESISEELESEKPDLSDYEPPAPRPAREPLDALYDSKRDYFTQLDRYHAWQGR